MREIDLALKNIGIRKHNDLAINANIHGHKMSYKSRPKQKKISELDKIQQDLVDKAIKERFKNGR